MFERLRAAMRARRPLIAVVPTRRLALAVAVASPLWALPQPLGVRVAIGALALIAIATIIDWVLLPSRKAVEFARAVPSSIGIGDDAQGQYMLQSRSARTVRATITDLFPAGLRGGVGQETLVLPPLGSAELTFDLRGMRRGRLAPGQVGLRLRTRAGLLARRVTYTPDDAVLVTPSVAGVRRFRLLALQHRLHDVGVRALRRRGEGRAFAALREYVVGDDPRHIDWKATGKRRKLITREYTIEQAQTVFTLIDAGRSMTQLAGDYARFEHALSSALVLTDVAATAGDRVGTLVFDDEVRAFVPAQRGQAALRGIRDALVPVEATLAEPDYATAFRLFATRQRKRALVVFFTDVIDARASRALLAQLTRGASRHLVVVVALRNDALFAAAKPGTGEDGLFQAAAAEELIGAREEALERMRRAGITVLDVSPQAMTAAVVNRYLEIKSRGAL